jgi:membrane-bound lytic murein transglycosylase B
MPERRAWAAGPGPFAHRRTLKDRRPNADLARVTWVTWVRAIAGALVVATVAAPAAAAPDTLEARAAAAARRVDVLLARSAAADAEVRRHVAALTSSFARTQQAELQQQAADAAVVHGRGEHARAVRAVYAGGGGLGLRATILAAGDPDDVLWRTASVDRVLGDLLRRSAAEVRLLRGAAAAAAGRRAAAEQADAAHGRALDEAQRQADAATAALDEASRTLAGLDAEVRAQKAAAEAARRLAEAQAADRAHGPTGPVTALGIPEAYERAYRAAAPSCPGLRWTLLAAVGQVESGHGRNTGPSSAGAVGPMQFMPATFRQYAVDGDRDGLADPWDPEDAIWTAARYLCVSGARGGSPDGVHDALFAYNRAEWYVQLVLATERAIVAAATGSGTATTSP